MDVAISSFAFGCSVAGPKPQFDALSLIQFAREHDVGVVQIGDHLPLHEMSGGALERLLEAARDGGIRIEIGARGLTDGHLSAYVDLCVRLEAKMLRFVIDQAGYEPAPDHIISILRDALPGLWATGVVLGLENHDRFPARVLRSIVDAVGDPLVGVCLDTANSFGAGEGLEHVTSILAPVTVNLHIKDVSIRRAPHQQGFLIEGCELGTGVLPIQETIAVVRASGRCTTAVLEAWTTPMADPEQTCRLEVERAARGLDTLRRWLK
jgi:sugar phosphate isomerase/epimerase